MKFNKQLQKTIEDFNPDQIDQERKGTLQILINYIQGKIDQRSDINLNFICTHNSRRSQFSQIWAQAAAYFYGISANCYSGGIEVTAFNERAVESLKRAGFEIRTEGLQNPRYTVSYVDNDVSTIAFSKLFDDPVNPATNFAAVMTCAHADKNCPFIPGAEQRIPVQYEDPKAFDDTPQEAMKYDERSMQIANEMFYVFSQVK